MKLWKISAAWLLVSVLLLSGCAGPATPPGTATPPTGQTTQTAAPPQSSTATTPPQGTTQVPPTTAAAPQEPTLLSFLQIATMPVGKTMYIWGGGWNEEDTAAGTEAVTLGLSPRWEAFAAAQDSSYDYNATRYQIHDGLDCSGYVGWAVYNALETENGREGYVMASGKMAQVYAQMGLGTYIPVSELTEWKPGDIMSMPGHVWIVVGMCSDGSVLFLHASPPGVMFSGTLLSDGSESEAAKLAKAIMESQYPDWHSRFPESARPYSYLTASSAMRWSQSVLSDPQGVGELSAEEVAALLFGEEFEISER